MVGAGALFSALVGIDYNLAILLTGAFMLTYVIFGGMIATTWVQIIKAVLLMGGATAYDALRARQDRLEPDRAVQPTRGTPSPAGRGLPQARPVPRVADRHVSLGLALVLGTAGLPHILMRFFTVPDAKAARSSVMWAVDR